MKDITEGMQPIKIKVSESGMEGQAVSPYRCTDGFLNTCLEMPESSICDECMKTIEFRAKNPPRPLTTAQTPNSIVEAKPVEQYKFMGLEWMNCGKYYTYNMCNHDGIPTRIAYEVIEQTTTKEDLHEARSFEVIDAPQSDLSVEEAAERFIEECGGCTGDVKPDFVRIFIAGHNHAIHSKQLVRMRDVTKLILDFDLSKYKEDNKYSILAELLTQLKTLTNHE